MGHPWVEVLTMVAPSPDWYAFASVNLFQGNAFINSTEGYAFGYDAGTDDGVTYEAANAPSSPRGTISSLSNMQPFSNPEVKLLKLRLVRKDELDKELIQEILERHFRKRRRHDGVE